MGEEPDDSEIPPDFEDFIEELQQVIQIYNMIPSKWDGFSGSYLGKEMAGVLDIFHIFEVHKEHRQFFLFLINKMDEINSKIINEKVKQKVGSNGNKGNKT